MESTDKQPIKTKKQLFVEQLSNRHPDVDFADEDTLFNTISDEYDERDKRMKEYEDNEQTFMSMFKSDPRSAAMLHQWKSGEDPVVYLVRNFGDELRSYLDDPEKVEELAKANKEYLERVSENNRLEEEYKKNIDESLSLLDRMVNEGRLTDDEIDDRIAYLKDIANKVLQGRFDEELIDMAGKAIHRDADVDAAERLGEVRGRNAKIEEKLRKAKTGDGVAQLDGKNKSQSGGNMPSLGVLDNYGTGSTTIYDRGGEKRIRVNNR